MSKLYEEHVPPKRRSLSDNITGYQKSRKLQSGLADLCLYTYVVSLFYDKSHLMCVCSGASELRTVTMFVIVNTRIKRFYILCTYLCQLGYLPSQQILRTLVAQSI